jgi:hypothetical protein
MMMIEINLHPCLAKWNAMPCEKSSPFEVSNTVLLGFAISMEFNVH